MRWALGVEYAGTHYAGWQAQRNVATVQQALEQALSKVANHAVSVVCAGRTDAGVHAVGQVVHFDSQAARSSRAWLLGGNSHLPRDIAVQWAVPIGADFHARFSAIGRTYHYLIDNRATRPGLWHGKLSWQCRALDIARMRTAANSLHGEHDFSSFRASACQAKSPVRTIRSLELNTHGAIISLRVNANGFLHHMVRNIAGVLVAVGSGEREPAWVDELLARRQRSAGGVTAPADGLYLTQVEYPSVYTFPRVPVALPGLLFN